VGSRVAPRSGDGVTSRRVEALVATSLALLALSLSLFDARRDAATADEPIHIAAGVAQATSGTWIVNVEHPPLAKQLFGLAAVAQGHATAPRLSFRDFFASTRTWLFAGGSDAILLSARDAAAFLFAGLVAAAYFAAGRGAGGLAASALIVGSTALFPHGHLATTDVPLALFTALLAGALKRYDEDPSPRRAGAASLWLAAALATKYTAVLYLPLVSLAVFLVRKPASRPRRLLAAFAVPSAGVLLLALALSWFVRNEPPGTLGQLGRLYRMPASDMRLLARADAVHHGLARWGFGLLFHLRQAEAGRLTYYDGPTTHPGAHYHLVALVVKSPATWLVGVLAGAFLAVRRGPRAARLFYAGAALLLVGSLPGPRIGVRHVFPSLVLASLAAGVALAPSAERRPIPVRAALLLVVLAPLASDRNLGAEGLAGRLFGRPLLADSNLDWGQDLLRLREELSHRGIQPADVAVAYFGGDVPAMRIPGVADLLETDAPPRRYLAVSRHLLLLGENGVLVRGTEARAARAIVIARSGRAKPAGVAGKSIEVFDLGDAGAPGESGPGAPRPATGIARPGLAPPPGG
jgi:hypothetical protein